jgi:hypothetical protein
MLYHLLHILLAEVLDQPRSRLLWRGLMIQLLMDPNQVKKRKIGVVGP